MRSPFEGITGTTADGTLVGEPDPRDWGCAPGSGAESGITGAAARQATPLAVPAPPPSALCLYPAYPNPSDQETRLQFSLPTARHVTLAIYAPGPGPGREATVVRTLLDSEVASGFFIVSWNLTDDNAARVAAGIYRAVLVAGDEALCGDIEVH
jgi:hypothetical protein